MSPGGDGVGVPDTRPRFPADRGGVAVLGAGTIAQSAHLPAYEQHGVGVTGVWSRSSRTTDGLLERFPRVRRVYGSAEELLADPAVRFVDLATGPEDRLAWISAAVDAGKHVLAQKPLTLSADDLDRLPEVLAAADRAGVRVAVNHNGRWAPPWRAATLLVRDGAVGDVVGVTHVHDKPLPPLAGTPFDDVPHMLLTDYLLHWVDITRSWLLDGGAGPVVSVQASDSRVPGQPAQARNPWSATLSMTAESGATATLRIPGSAVSSRSGCPFWVHGTTGTLRGSVLLDSDRLDLDDGTSSTSIPLQGAWFVDGFAAAMGELMCAVEEDRSPENSAADAALSVRLVLAARDSADRGGVPVEVAA
ncbi:Gfo/Idh/MocA family oxidoreductase [Nocardioides sp. zg-1308]|uniref:Gfo/Idh/MocA family protein n=1 Tax=Nocardioides sp. zg-1308 TaxID=2736253 RepID=UPI00155627D2|nr:Gfo/Idh/MocA family oxidoreductase [Nocardioides sp. zg-1308]